MQNFLSRLLRWLGLAAAALVVVTIGFAAFWLVALTRDLPSIETRKVYEPPITTRVYAGNGTVLGEFAHERRIFVPATFIPKLVKQAFISAEDRNFYNHPGVDPSGASSRATGSRATRWRLRDACGAPPVVRPLLQALPPRRRVREQRHHAADRAR